MSNTREIRMRLTSVRKIGQITRAMKMVAGVKFRRAQANLLDSRLYAARVRELAAGVLGQCEAGEHPLLRPRPSRRLLLVVVTSDRGLCGSFNSNLARRVREYLREQGAGGAAAPTETGLYVIGRKGHEIFRRYVAAQSSVRLQHYVPLAEAQAEAIGKELIGLYLTGAYDRIELFFNEFKSVIQQRPLRDRLLPLEAPAGAVKPPPRLVEPVLVDLLPDLLERLLFTQVRRILLESQASEHGARMSMMDQASKNADEMMGALRLSFNKARQMNITRELADITTGAEAMA